MAVKILEAVNARHGTRDIALLLRQWRSKMLFGSHWHGQHGTVDTTLSALQSLY
jgi:hypothetical protein